jgi:hypothetical protein
MLEKAFFYFELAFLPSSSFTFVHFKYLFVVMLQAHGHVDQYEHLHVHIFCTHPVCVRVRVCVPEF